MVKELIISSVGYVGERVGKRAKNGKERLSEERTRGKGKKWEKIFS